MRILPRKPVRFSELVMAAFERAAQYSADPREVSRLATRVVTRISGRARWLSLPVIEY